VVVSHILTIGQQPSRRRCICKCNLTGYEMEICSLAYAYAQSPIAVLFFAFTKTLC